MPGYAPASATTSTSSPTNVPSASSPDLGVHHHPAAVDHRHHVLAAALGPLDRPSDRAGELADEDVLGVEAGLGAEAAADHRRRDAEAAGFHAELGGERVADGDRVLARDPHGELAVGAGDRDAAVGLHGNARQTLADRAAFRHVGGTFEGIAVVFSEADPGLEHDVRPVLLEQQRRTLDDGRFGVDERRQRIDVDDHRLGGVDRLRQRLGDDDRHDVADEAHLALGERGTSGDGRHQRERHERCQLERVGRVGGDHAWHRRGRADIDRVERSVGERRPDEVRVREPVDGHVVVVLVGTHQQRRVLPAQNRVTEDRTFRWHRALPLLVTFHGEYRAPARRSPPPGLAF